MKLFLIIVFFVSMGLPVNAQDKMGSIAGEPLHCKMYQRIKTSELVHDRHFSFVHSNFKDNKQEIGIRKKKLYDRLKNKKANPLSPVAWQIPDANAMRCAVHANPPPTVQTIDLQFTAGTLTDLPTEVNFSTPDTMGAVGSKQFVTFVNNGTRSYDKQTGIEDQALDISLQGFFKKNVTDPRLKFDVFTNRWFATVITFPEFEQTTEQAAQQAGTHPNFARQERSTRATNSNSILIAISDSDVITKCSGWTVFEFPLNLVSPVVDEKLNGDFDATGIDQHALYVGLSLFDDTEAFSNSAVYVFQKSSLLSGTPVATAFRNLVINDNGPFPAQGVDNFDANPEFGYVVGTDLSQFGTMCFYRIINPGSTSPSISPLIQVSIPLDSGINQFGLPHKGNLYPEFGLLFATPGRLSSSPHVRNGQLYVCEDTGVNVDGVVPAPFDTSIDRVAVRFFQFDMSGAGVEAPTTAPTIKQCGQIYDSSATPTPRSYFYGSLMTNKQNDMIVGFSTTSAVDYVNAAYAGRLGTDPLGTIGAPIIYTNSQEPYQYGIQPEFRAQRWGDYTNTCLDPSDQLTIWTIQQWTKYNSVWGLEVARIPAP